MTFRSTSPLTPTSASGTADSLPIETWSRRRWHQVHVVDPNDPWAILWLCPTQDCERANSSGRQAGRFGHRWFRSLIRLMVSADEGPGSECSCKWWHPVGHRGSGLRITVLHLLFLTRLSNTADACTSNTSVSLSDRANRFLLVTMKEWMIGLPTRTARRKPGWDRRVCPPFPGAPRWIWTGCC